MAARAVGPEREKRLHEFASLSRPVWPLQSFLATERVKGRLLVDKDESKKSAMVFGHSIEFMDALGFWLMIAGGLRLVASFASSV